MNLSRDPLNGQVKNLRFQQIHHDRITFSLHEPTRGQTFKSALKRDVITDEVTTTESPAPSPHIRVRKTKKREPVLDESIQKPVVKKFHTRNRSKVVEGKGLVKERNDSGYKRSVKNRIKIREDVSDDTSE